MSQERHLSEAQISAYVSATPDVSSETESETESHLEECGSCRNRMLEMHRDQMGFRKAGGMNRDCPEDEILQLVAAGGSEPAIAASTMDHAARCSQCGPRLKKLANIFSGDLSPEQQKIMAQLQTSNPEWQREFIRAYVRPRGSAAKDKDKTGQPGLWAQIFGTWWGRAGMAAASAAVVLAAVFEVPVLSAKYDLYHAQKLVASAYGERRTIEPRFSGAPAAGFNPYPIELGPDDERGLDVNRPELMKAEGTVADKVKEQDPRWLQLQGQISLLEATPKSIAQAQKYFEEAQRKGLNTPSLKIDLASSYYEHDVRAEYPNLQRTLDLLLEVLHQPNLSTEDRATALFDLAIAYEKTQAWDLAASTWEDYLKVDSAGPWADQARDRLKKAKEKIPAPKPQGYNQPIFFLEHLSQLKPEDAEEYQAIALSQWLPDALEHGDAQAREAVNKLAEVLVTQHSDPWLRDFSSALKPQDLPALKLLNEAIQDNTNGKNEAAIEKSSGAESAFAEPLNPAGAMRAHLEQVYAQRRFLQGSDCLAKADALSRRLTTTHYKWLEARVALERAECQNLRGDFTESDNSFKASRTIAEEFGFPELSLQISGIGAGNERLRGRCDESWSDSVQALDLYWRGAYPRGERLFQFYAVMLQCALDTNALYAAEGLIEHTILMRRDPIQGFADDPKLDGLLHTHLANILKARRLDLAARQERGTADSLFKQVRDANPLKYKLIADLELAQFQLDQQDSAAALDTLDEVSKLLPNNQDQFLALNFHRIRGNAYFRSAQYEAAVDEFESAIRTSERSLRGLRSAIERSQWLRATDVSYRGLVRVLLAQHKDEQAFARWEWYKSRSWAQDLIDGHANARYTPSRSEEQTFNHLRSLAGAKTRIVYALLRDGIQTWVLTESALHSQWISIEPRDFDRAARTFATICSTPDSAMDDVRQEAEGLYAILIQPIASILPERGAVIIEPDRGAYDLPIEALIDQAGRYFGERYAVVYSPGLLLETALRGGRPVENRDQVLLVDASRTFNNSYLPGLEAEKRTISQIFPHTQSARPDTTGREELFRLIASSQIFIYLGHGKLSGDGTDLALTMKDSLSAADFQPSILRSMRLGVLSACSTGRGQKDGLLDTQNLVHSFLAGGVPSVVASRWSVDSESTARLMNAFYEGLHKQKTISEALHSARVEILHAQPHPFYWAAFNLSGRGE